ncbi:13575_t:CDS:2, partial [Acaulospora colombiana]
MTTDHSDYVFVFTAADAGSANQGTSWYQNFFRPNGTVHGSNYMATADSTNVRSLSNNYDVRQATSNAAPPPSYEEAIADSVNPSTFTITPVAQSVNVRPPEQILVIPNDASRGEGMQNDYSGTETDRSKLLSNDEVNRDEGGTSYSREAPFQVPSGYETSSPPEYTMSDANFHVSDRGVTSSDPKLNNEAESLYRFFIAHNNKPQMAVSIHGYHSEWQDETYTYVDQNGDTKFATRSKHVEVTDFKYTCDLTDYIFPNGEVHIIDKENCKMNIMDLLKEYVENRNILKEIEMRKVVLWDYESLTKAISSAIRRQ